ncbi:hypothetical protein QQ045_012308 [Rhodiola kirilowii]
MTAHSSTLNLPNSPIVPDLHLANCATMSDSDRKYVGKEGDESAGDRGGRSSRSGRRRVARRPVEAPATWRETINTLSETLKFTYTETLGKWPIGDLAFGINYLMRRQKNMQVANVFAGSNCKLLGGPGIIAELYNLLRLLTLCMLFSKKPFPVFLDSGGFSESDVLLQKPKAALLKPAFTILRDETSKCILLLIRGTHSIKDTLTAATGGVAPFHHTVVNDGGVSELVLGYARCGMVAAARWIAKLSSPVLLEALNEYPDFQIKIVGHSLGGGTAALLTYILREQQAFSTCTCVTFAPAPCMTWELAESGKHFITTTINNSDLVPTFSASSVDDLRSEVMASSWLNDLRAHVERTRVLNVFYRSASALGSRLPSIATAKAKVVGAGALLRPVSNSTQVVMKRAQNVAQAVVMSRSTLTSWSCMGARRRIVTMSSDDGQDSSEEMEITSSCSEESGPDETDEKKERTNLTGRMSSLSTATLSSVSTARMSCTSATTKVVSESEGELWYELEKELRLQEQGKTATEQEIIEDTVPAVADTASRESSSTPALDSLENNQHFFPPGRIMHIVSIPSNEGDDLNDARKESIGIYETPRELYSKLRLSKTMINDHYMPMYKKNMELLIAELEKDVDSRSTK